MKTINVSARARTLTSLLKQVDDGGLILRAPNGKYFVLAAIEGWEGFDVGSGRSFAQEVKLTGRNKELMRFLARRRSEAKRLSLAKVKQQLGLD